MAKNSNFSTFLISAKTVHTIRSKIFTVIFYTIVWSMCAISINSYNWDWSESEGKRPKATPLPHMRLWLTKAFIQKANLFTFLSEIGANVGKNG